MDEQILRDVIIDQKHEAEEIIENIIQRQIPDLHIYLKKPNVLAIMGIRRCGKSTLALNLIKNLKAAYVNFDDERLINTKADDLNKLLEVVYSVYGNVDVFLFDEIENIVGWELFIRRLRNTKKIILTGSNSNLLSGELSTHLTGRHIDFILFPFSFSEFLRYNSFEINRDYSTLDKGLILKYFHIYMDKGGFPESIIIDKKMAISIYNDIIQKDIINRYKIRKINDFKNISKYIVSNYSNEFSYSMLKNFFNIDIHTIIKYANYLENSYIVFILHRFSFKVKEQYKTSFKIYIIDTVIPSLNGFLPTNSFGNEIENIVFIELLRRKSNNFNNMEIFYYKANNYEVDFLLFENNVVKQLINVTYVSDYESINKREINSLLKAGEEVNCSDLILITMGLDRIIEKDGFKIKAMPVWIWLLHEG